MPIEAGQKYDAVVRGAKFTESSKMTPGVWVNFLLLDPAGASLGFKPKTIWLSAANRDQARKELKTLGATDAQLVTREFFANIANYLVGVECAVVTEEREYNGSKSVDIKWINSRVKAASAAALDAIGSLFADAPAGDGGYDEDPGPQY